MREIDHPERPEQETVVVKVKVIAKRGAGSEERKPNGYKNCISDGEDALSGAFDGSFLERHILYYFSSSSSSSKGMSLWCLE